MSVYPDLSGYTPWENVSSNFPYPDISRPFKGSLHPPRRAGANGARGASGADPPEPGGKGTTW